MSKSKAIEKYHRAIERSVKLNRRLRAIGLNILLGVSPSRYSKFDKICHFIYLENINTGKTKHSINRLTDSEIIEEAIKMSRPQFIKLDKVCVNIIGEIVYYNKIEPLMVKSILNKETLLTEDERELEIKDCYIKEEA